MSSHQAAPLTPEELAFGAWLRGRCNCPPGMEPFDGCCVNTKAACESKAVTNRIELLAAALKAVAV
jgi:hypothetical protein